MGSYNWAFWFNDLEIDTHMTFGQGVFAIHNSVQRTTNIICCVENFDYHYQKPYHKDVMFAPNQNHEATYNEVCKSNKHVYSDVATQCSHVERRLESFRVKGKVCHSTFGFNSSNLA
jgi:glycyl-tRNA synthetase alpha subunit